MGSISPNLANKEAMYQSLRTLLTALFQSE